LKIPQGVHVTLNNGVFTVKGPKGEVSRELRNPTIKSSVDAGKIVFESKQSTQREKKLVMTFIAHLGSMFEGVQHGHTYKLKVCSSHFPMTVAVKAGQLEIKNFIGETVPRFTKIPQGVNVKVDGQIIVLEGVSKEKVSQTAAQIEQTTKRPGFDKRIFQDGIFIIEKDGKPLKV
jgi:large subunit ribosomal protein L6